MEEGRHAALVEQGGLYAEMWARQVCFAADQGGRVCFKRWHRNPSHPRVCVEYQFGGRPLCSVWHSLHWRETDATRQAREQCAFALND